jgi:hypothetical protein
VEFIDDERDCLPLRGRKRRLGRNSARRQVEQCAANQGSHIFAHVERVQVDDDDLPVGDELAKVDRRFRLANNLAGDPTTEVLVNLGLDGIDDLEPESRIQVVEVALEPVADHRVTGAFEHLSPELPSLEQWRGVEDRVLRAATGARIRRRQRLVCLVQGEHSETECVLHTRTPETVEFSTEDPQSIGGCLIAIPTESSVEEIDSKTDAFDSKRPGTRRHVAARAARARERQRTDRGADRTSTRQWPFHGYRDGWKFRPPSAGAPLAGASSTCRGAFWQPRASAAVTVRLASKLQRCVLDVWMPRSDNSHYRRS